jgi:hypothetical protein
LSISSRELERSLSAAEALQATKRMHLPEISFVGQPVIRSIVIDDGAMSKLVRSNLGR